MMNLSATKTIGLYSFGIMISIFALGMNRVNATPNQPKANTNLSCATTYTYKRKTEKVNGKETKVKKIISHNLIIQSTAGRLARYEFLPAYKNKFDRAYQACKQEIQTVGVCNPKTVTKSVYSSGGVSGEGRHPIYIGEKTETNYINTSKVIFVTLAECQGSYVIASINPIYEEYQVCVQQNRREISTDVMTDAMPTFGSK